MGCARQQNGWWLLSIKNKFKHGLKTQGLNLIMNTTCLKNGVLFPVLLGRVACQGALELPNICHMIQDVLKQCLLHRGVPYNCINLLSFSFISSFSDHATLIFQNKIYCRWPCHSPFLDLKSHYQPTLIMFHFIILVHILSPFNHVQCQAVCFSLRPVHSLIFISYYDCCLGIFWKKKHIFPSFFKWKWH